jgi:hypothetical protein
VQFSVVITILTSEHLSCSQAAENEAALLLLPELLKEIDESKDKGAQFETVIKGVFAGNIFDLGAGKVCSPL